MDNTQQTILVTGGCGYIGSHVVQRLTKAGAAVVVLDDLSTGFRDALVQGETLYQGDVSDTALLGRIFSEHRVDTILHFAGKIRSEESVTDPYLYYSTNTLKTLQLIQTAVRHEVPRFIFSSTAAVYGQSEVFPVLETATPRPESPYGASKLMSERMLQDMAAATGLKFVILRYFNVAGNDPSGRIGQRTPNASHLIKVACEAALGQRAGLTIHGTDYPTRDGTCIRDYIHVEDLASAHELALQYLRGGGESQVLNCGYGTGSTVREVVRAVKEVSGVDFPVREGPRRPGDPGVSVAGVERVKALLGWQPRYDDLLTIVEHAYGWERQLAAGNTE